MKELDRENEILINPKECQTIPQISKVSTQTISIMISYVDHETQTINENSDENDSQISKSDSQSQADDLLRKKYLKIVQMNNPREVLLLFNGPVC